jgi:hypothetical protein
MQRLHPWLMPGLACYTLSVGLIGLHLNLERVAYLLMAIGSAVILYGVLSVVTFPAIVWHCGRFGKFDRALRRRIASGRTALQAQLDHESWLGWTRTTEAVLTVYLGGMWHPWFAKFNNAEILEPTEGFGDERRLTISKRLVILGELRQALRNQRDTFVIFPTRLKV